MSVFRIVAVSHGAAIRSEDKLSGSVGASQPAHTPLCQGVL